MEIDYYKNITTVFTRHKRTWVEISNLITKSYKFNLIKNIKKSDILHKYSIGF